MSKETIELLKGYDPKKLSFPAMHQQKFDGVPTLILNQHGVCTAYSRQGEKFTSVPHLIKFCQALLLPGEAVVMELLVDGLPFKEISGIVRRHAADARVYGMAFDFVPAGASAQPYISRREELRFRLGRLAFEAACTVDDFKVKLIPGVRVNDSKAADGAHDSLMTANPDAEGSVYHSMDKPFNPGSRHWTTQKRKPIPTIDLRIVSFDEAISADTGLGLGMVGRLNAEYTMLKDGKQVLELIGIGPGALTHTERKNLWKMQKAGQYTPRIAEIKYMRDDSYDALRQPTFKVWRDDKETPDVANT